MRNRLAVILGLVTAVLTVAVVAQTDVTGTWNMTIDTEQGSAPATLMLQQDGEKLTGSAPATLMLQQDGEKLTGSLVSDQGTVEFEGTIAGDKLEWVMEIDAGGVFLEITIEGTVDGDEMMGTLDLGGYGGGDWTAKRMP